MPNFADALFQGMDDANAARQRQQSLDRQNRLADLSVAKEERAAQGDQRERLYGMSKGYLDYISKNPTGGKQYYDTFLRPDLTKMVGDPGEYNEGQAKDLAAQVVSAYGNQGSGTTVADQFTLAPGSKRFDASGRLVAEVPSSAQRGTAATTGAYIDPALPEPVKAAIRQHESSGTPIPSQFDLGAEQTSSAPAVPPAAPVAPGIAKAEAGMRKEVQGRIDKDRSILGMYDNVQNAARSASAAGDLSLIFAFMKMLDPGSVVREQEFANAQNAAGIPDRILNFRNQVLSGQRLNPNQRAQFINEARQLASAAQGRITNVTRGYQNSADQYGYDPTRATGMGDFRGVQSNVQRAGNGDQLQHSNNIDDILSKYGAGP